MEALKTILFATGNKHKVEEVNTVLKRCGYIAEPAPAPKLEIQAESLEEVVLVAAAQAYHMLRRPVIVEDAGLFIEALRGFPGPYSSYVYKTIGIKGVLKLMDGVENRKARFVSVIALAHSSGIELFRGEVEGVIAKEPRGAHGFGFDPIFIPAGASKTFAEMSVEEKTRYSHRGRAAEKLCQWLARSQPT